MKSRLLLKAIQGHLLNLYPCGLEDAFDPLWWKQVGGDLSTSALSLGLEMQNEGKPCSDEPQHIFPSSYPQYSDLRLNQTTSNPSPLQRSQKILSISTHANSIVQCNKDPDASVITAYISIAQSLSSCSWNVPYISFGQSHIGDSARFRFFSVAEEAKEEWRSQRGVSVRVVRPLRDVGMKECAIWDWWCGLRIVGRSRKFIQGGGRSAIGALTRGTPRCLLVNRTLMGVIDFIFGLESDFPATVSTVARTCAKLTPKEGSDGTCVLCERLVVTIQYFNSLLNDACFPAPPNMASKHGNLEYLFGLTTKYHLQSQETPGLHI